MKRNVFAIRQACRTGRAAIDTGGFHRKPKLAIGPFVLIDKRLPTRIVCEEKLALASDCWLGNLCHTQNVPLPLEAKTLVLVFKFDHLAAAFQSSYSPDKSPEFERPTTSIVKTNARPAFELPQKRCRFFPMITEAACKKCWTFMRFFSE
jgi:hypothetical protein